MNTLRRAGGRWTTTMLIAAGLAVAVVAAGPAEPRSATERAEFELREITLGQFEAEAGPHSQDLLRGQAVYCTSEPSSDVKAYPKLRSAAPWYGDVTFGRNWSDREGGVKFHFVLDESGSPPAEEKDPEVEPSESLLDRLLSALKGEPKDQPKTKKPVTFDRLYIDLNGDLDLTNDPVVMPRQDKTAPCPEFWRDSPILFFDDIAFELDFGSELGVRRVAVVPRLMTGESDGKTYASMFFVFPIARKGKIEIGSQKYEALLAQPYYASGRFDGPGTSLYLTPSGGEANQQEYWWGHDELGAMRWIDGRYYTTSATPLGDRLIVSPYQGEVGVFSVGPGERPTITSPTVSGSLRSKDHAVAVGKPGEQGALDAIERCELPVGDYLLNYVSVEYGDLRISLSHNYHSDGKLRDSDRELVYSIAIRPDKPFVLDFSNKPEVMFASPAKDQTFKPGDEIEVKAVLTDPVLDAMIRGLDNKKVLDKASTLGDDAWQKRPWQLDPLVTITDAGGKIVSEGKMPFG